MSMFRKEKLYGVVATIVPDGYGFDTRQESILHEQELNHASFEEAEKRAQYLSACGQHAMVVEVQPTQTMFLYGRKL